MSASSIEWILVVSGIITAIGGLGAFLSPGLLLRSGFGVGSPDASALFLARHWGVLIFVIGALIVHVAYADAVRAPILIAAAVEKFAIGALVFFGPLQRTAAMTAIAVVDGIFALFYVAYLAGL